MDDFIEFVPPRAIVSPCRNVCRLDRTQTWCLGCARTRDEIARWTQFTEVERDRIMAELPQRPTRTA